MSKDYCSFVPDGTWGIACEVHDIDYAKVRAARKYADCAFRDYLVRLGHPLVAKVYYVGVRIFGRLFT